MWIIIIKNYIVAINSCNIEKLKNIEILLRLFIDYF